MKNIKGRNSRLRRLRQTRVNRVQPLSAMNSTEIDRNMNSKVLLTNKSPSKQQIYVSPLSDTLFEIVNKPEQFKRARIKILVDKVSKNNDKTKDINNLSSRFSKISGNEKKSKLNSESKM